MNKYYAAHKQLEGDRDKTLITNWDNLFWASNVLLAGVTDAGAFHIATQVHHTASSAFFAISLSDWGNPLCLGLATSGLATSYWPCY